MEKPEVKTLKNLFLIASIFLLVNICYGQKATLTVCENTDDNVNPINPMTTIKVNQPVVYQIAFDKPYKGDKEETQFFIAWEVYKIGDDGKDAENITELSMRTNTGYRRYAIEEFQRFTAPGKYRVYALEWEKRNVNFKYGNYKDYFGKKDITVEE